MTAVPNKFLLTAAMPSGLASLLHVAVPFGGAPWYRFFGAGERMARMAEAGHWYPTVVTLGIAFVLFVWAMFALAGAGLIAKPPFAKPVLGLVTAVYLLRGLVIVPALAFAVPPATPFWIWSSAICLGYGIVHLVGVIQAWDRL